MPFQTPIALVCVATISKGAPVGAQSAWLSSNSSGWPLDLMRNAAVVHCAVTQGPLPAVGGGIVHPATA